MGNKYLERSKPQYDNIASSNFLTARAFGAKGDGVTDDTAALNALFLSASSAFSHGIAFVDAGFYLVTDTVRIPPNVRIVGEALAAVIMGSGAKFENISAPHPVVQVGKPGEKGYIEWSDMIVSTQGPTAGAVLIEYNLETQTGPCVAVYPPSGMWDVHVRVGGFAGSQLQVSQCGKTPQLLNYVNPACVASYLSMHITRYATNLYLENNWFWVADHDIEDPQGAQVSVFSGRGLLIESQKGHIWLVGTAAEHHVKYQYQLVNTHDIWMGLIQTETPYFQPNPTAPAPFTFVDTDLHDPDFVSDCAADSSATAQLPGSPPCAMAWGLRVVDSRNISIHGAGLYSFFNNYDTSCSAPGNGEHCQARMVYAGMSRNETTRIAATAQATTDLEGSDESVNTTAVQDAVVLLHDTAILAMSNMTGIEIYNLNTLGAVSMITRQDADVALYRENVAGYTSCVVLFKFWQNQSSLGKDVDIGTEDGHIPNGSSPLLRPAVAAHSPSLSPESACYGDEDKICSERQSNKQQKRVAHAPRPDQVAKSILPILNGVPMPFGTKDENGAGNATAHKYAEAEHGVVQQLTTDASTAGMGNSILTLSPTLGSQYPSPLPSQTDCNFDYVW